MHNSNLGEAIMVDVGWKPVTRRLARAVAIIDIGPTAYQLVTKNEVSHCVYDNFSCLFTLPLYLARPGSSMLRLVFSKVA